MPLDPQTLMQWSGCALGVSGSFVLARNDRHSGWGFVAYLASNAAWLGYAVVADVRALAIQQVAFMAISGFGVWRWLVRPRVDPRHAVMPESSVESLRAAPGSAPK